jgi:hypothetical protein
MRLLMIKYLDILRAELVHIERTIAEMVTDHVKRETVGAETEHVCFENVATLENEESGVRGCLQAIETIQPADYPDLDTMIAELDRRFREVIRKTGLAEIAYVFAQQKLLKVKRYVVGE